MRFFGEVLKSFLKASKKPSKTARPAKCVKGTNQGKPTGFFLCTFITESIPKQYVFMYGDNHQIYTTGTQSKQIFKN